MENKNRKITCPVHPEQTRDSLDSYLDCQFCKEDRLNESEKRESDNFTELVARRLDRLGNGKRFKEKEFSTFYPVTEDEKIVFKTCQRYVVTFKDRLKEGDNLLFMGTEGTGKTHLSIAIAKKLVRAGHTAFYTSLFKMIANLKRSWGSSSANEEQIMKIYTEPEILIIDEVGVQFKSNVEQVYLMNIINTRYENMLPTIMITNLDEDVLKEVIGAQVLDRFYEGKSSVLSCTWPSHRRKENNEST